MALISWCRIYTKKKYLSLTDLLVVTLKGDNVVKYCLGIWQRFLSKLLFEWLHGLQENSCCCKILSLVQNWKPQFLTILLASICFLVLLNSITSNNAVGRYQTHFPLEGTIVASLRPSRSFEEALGQNDQQVADMELLNKGEFATKKQGFAWSNWNCVFTRVYLLFSCFYPLYAHFWCLFTHFLAQKILSTKSRLHKKINI